MLYQKTLLLSLFFTTAACATGNIKCRGERHALRVTIAHGNGSPIVGDLTLSLPKNEPDIVIPKTQIIQYKNFEDELFLMVNDTVANPLFLLDTKELPETKETEVTKGTLKFFRKKQGNYKHKVIEVLCQRN